MIDEKFYYYIGTDEHQPFTLVVSGTIKCDATYRYERTVIRIIFLNILWMEEEPVFSLIINKKNTARLTEKALTKKAMRDII